MLFKTDFVLSVLGYFDISSFKRSLVWLSMLYRFCSSGSSTYWIIGSNSSPKTIESASKRISFSAVWISSTGGVAALGEDVGDFLMRLIEIGSTPTSSCWRIVAASSAPGPPANAAAAATSDLSLSSVIVGGLRIFISSIGIFSGIPLYSKSI